MGKTNIQWADYTFNPWVGCTKVSPACDHCYAESWAKRSGLVEWGQGNPRRRTSKANWNKPHQWNKQAEKEGTRYKVFCASLADVFDNEVPQEWREDLWRLIDDTQSLDWLLLTKRVGNVGQMAPQEWNAFGWPENVWLGITVVTQEEVERDIPKAYKFPVSVFFLSCEPLLSELRLSEYLHEPPLGNDFVEWVIVGGESGSGARGMDEKWARSIRDQCKTANIPFFMKQMSGKTKKSMSPIPDDLMIREFPANQENRDDAAGC